MSLGTNMPLMRRQIRASTRAGQLVVRRLRARGLTMNAFSRAKQRSPGRLSRLVSGDREPTLREALMLRIELGIPVGAWIRPPRHIKREDGVCNAKRGDA